jgi:hypothetical protein
MIPTLKAEEKRSKWAIRDIDHGKTFFFESFDEMVEWCIKQSKGIVEIN